MAAGQVIAHRRQRLVIDRVTHAFVDGHDQILAGLGQESGWETQRFAHFAVCREFDDELGRVRFELDRAVDREHVVRLEQLKGDARIRLPRAEYDDQLVTTLLILLPSTPILDGQGCLLRVKCDLQRPI